MNRELRLKAASARFVRPRSSFEVVQGWAVERVL